MVTSDEKERPSCRQLSIAAFHCLPPVNDGATKRCRALRFAAERQKLPDSDRGLADEGVLVVTRRLKNDEKGTGLQYGARWGSNRGLIRLKERRYLIFSI